MKINRDEEEGRLQKRRHGQQKIGIDKKRGDKYKKIEFFEKQEEVYCIIEPQER